MAKYLLLTFVLNVITIIVTVIIINVYFRTPTTHSMPLWVETVFLYVSFVPLITNWQSYLPLICADIQQKKKMLLVLLLQYLPKFLCLPQPPRTYKKMIQINKKLANKLKKSVHMQTSAVEEELHHPLCHLKTK